MVEEINKLTDEKTLEEETSKKVNIIRVTILIVVSAAVIVAGIYFKWHKGLVAGVLFLFGMVSQAWGSLLGLIGSIPGVGWIIVKFLALPLILIINGVGNMVAFLAIKMGYKKEILDTKLLTWSFALGAMLGFIIGKVL